MEQIDDSPGPPTVGVSTKEDGTRTAFMDLFCSHTIYDVLIKHLNAPDILQLLATCRRLQGLKSDIWNPNHLLSRFVRDVHSFRDLMREHNAMISGSAALGFLNRDWWNGSDLDVYVQDENAVTAFHTNVLYPEGYRYSVKPWQAATLPNALKEYWQKGNEMIAKYDFQDWDNQDAFQTDEEDETISYDSKTCFAEHDVAYHSAFFFTCLANDLPQIFCFEKDGKQIQIMLTWEPPVLTVLSDYYSTHILNFITADKAYSLFPYHTFKEKAGYMTKRCYTLKVKAAIAKYETRGWMIRGFREPHVCSGACPFQLHRQVGDSLAWSLKLGAHNLDTAQTRALEMTTFGMGRQGWEYEPPDIWSASWDRDDATQLMLDQRIGYAMELDVMPYTQDRLMYTYAVNHYKWSKSEFPQSLGPDFVPSWKWFLQGKLVSDSSDDGYLDHLVPGWYGEWKGKYLDRLGEKGTVLEEQVVQLSEETGSQSLE